MKRVAIVALLALASVFARADDFGFTAPAAATDPAVGDALRDLAERILPVYQEPDQNRYLANLSALQLVAGNYQAADGSRRALRQRRIGEGQQPDSRAILIDLYARARAQAEKDNVPPAQAFAQAFRETVPQLPDADAYAVTTWLGAPAGAYEEPLQRALNRARGHASISVDDAIHLMWTYLALEADRSFAPQLAALGSQEDERRFIVADDVVIKSGRARIHARVVRPKGDDKLPALLEFSMVDREADARACAAHGYAGIVAYVRGKDVHGKNVDDVVIPFEHDGEDARAVIRWITRQPWSDGRVGMYGSGYAGFTAWAAAKHLPKALKAIATTDAMAPGIDFPAEGRVFRNGAYRWAYNNTQADAETLDDAQWRAIDQRWYQSGKSYADLDRLAKRPSRAFHRWLGHPSYDRYWQKMIPFGDEFARVDIPVLTTSGFAGHTEAGALYYFDEHTRHRRKADHTLVLGASDDSILLDTAQTPGRVDLRELRLQWFDHVLKGAERPALLADRVNYQLAGTSEWRHVAKLDAMPAGTSRWYFDVSAKGTRHRLAAKPTSGKGSVALTVDFADRSDVNARITADAVLRNPAIARAVLFASEPLREATDVAGLVSGELDFKLNREDVDLRVSLYEQLADGSFQAISDPYEFRASYAADRTTRQPLARNQRQKLAFRSEQIASRRLQAGSRILVLVAVNKRVDRQINYGSGKDVSEETIADAKHPLKVQWLGGFVELPMKAP
ncbi:MAG TPA: CocE/NonD family hydrolase [Nevskiaceae bacterium]|nr:CocE/NonD family hydrolase [Nevskiaceae bacterium]